MSKAITHYKLHGKPSILFIVFAVALWGVGGVLIFWTLTRSTEMSRLSQLMTTIAPGAEIHMDGVIAPGPMIISPLTKTACVAFIFSAHYVTEYREGKTNMEDSAQLTFQRSGPDFIPITTQSGPLILPLALWKTGSPKSFFWPGTLKETDSIPNHINIPPQDIQKAAHSTKGEFKHFEFHEWVLTANMQIFIAATLGSTRDPSGAFILNHDPFHEQNIDTDGVYIYPGTQDDFLKILQHENLYGVLSGGLMILLSLIPLGFFFVRFRRYQRHQQSLTHNAKPQGGLP